MNDRTCCLDSTRPGFGRGVVVRELSRPTSPGPGGGVADRWFLDRIATHILAFEGDSHVEWFEGNYEDYEKDHRRRVGAEADQPHRIKYRKIDA